MNLESIKNALSEEAGFRLRQVKQAVFCDLAEDWDEAKTLPAALRRMLKERFPIDIEARDFISEDGKTIKALIVLSDELKIETVLMRHKDRNTVCVSSQIGCPLACAFCATGQMGFKRNLDKWEIVEQVLFFARLLKKENQKVTNVVFMGMGEPFLNYENVLGAIKILNDKEGFNLGARHFSISTVGITEGIEKLAQEKMEINLAISLHAPNDKLRSNIMPIGKKYPLGKILRVVDKYIKRTRRRVMFEYIMIKDINDSKESALELAKIMERPLCFVNLISYNPTGVFCASPPARVGKFKEILEKAGVAVTQRYRFGEDIKAACGQLAGKNNN